MKSYAQQQQQQQQEVDDRCSDGERCVGGVWVDYRARLAQAHGDKAEAHEERARLDAQVWNALGAPLTSADKRLP